MTSCYPEEYNDQHLFCMGAGGEADCVYYPIIGSIEDAYSFHISYSPINGSWCEGQRQAIKEALDAYFGLPSVDDYWWSSSGSSLNADCKVSTEMVGTYLEVTVQASFPKAGTYPFSISYSIVGPEGTSYFLESFTVPIVSADTWDVIATLSEKYELGKSYTITEVKFT